MKKVFATCVCSAVFGCANVGADAGESSPNEEVSTADSQLCYAGYQKPDGFWQVSGGPNVYWLHEGRVCWVRDPGMLAAIQWKSVPSFDPYDRPDWDTLHCNRVDDVYCHFPDNKMFRVKDTAYVYRTLPNMTFCHVKDVTQLARFGGWSNVLWINLPLNQVDYSEGGGVPGTQPYWSNSNALRKYVGGCSG